jgi:cobalamin biosynthesis protein CobT
MRSFAARVRGSQARRGTSDDIEPGEDQLADGDEGRARARLQRRGAATGNRRPKRTTSRHHALRRDVEAEELCDAEELMRLRAYLDQQMASSQSVVTAAGQPASAAADGAAGAKLAFRPGGGDCSTPRASPG